MLTYIDVIPAKRSIRPGEDLNILGGAANHGSDLETDLTVWGNAGDGWRAIVTERFLIKEGEHKHLYFTLTPEMLRRSVWEDGPEEFDLIIRDKMPAPEENGVMIFVNE